jgi:hypothetical protein
MTNVTAGTKRAIMILPTQLTNESKNPLELVFISIISPIGTSSLVLGDGWSALQTNHHLALRGNRISLLVILLDG